MNKIPNRQAICEVLMEHAAADPDIIVMTGDMQNKDDENTSIVCNLIKKLSAMPLGTSCTL